MTDYKLMPVEPTQEMLSRVMNIVTGFSGPYGEYNDYLDEETAREVYEAFSADAPDVQGEPVGADEDYLAHAVNTLNAEMDKTKIDQAVDSAMQGDNQ